jgi:hypothetical protein
VLKRVIHAVVGVVGLVLIGLAIASATVWRADDVLHASATADAAIVVTDPGVLEMAGDPVTVTATVPAGGRVVLVVGRDTDVAGWVGADAHERVTGLATWHALALASGASPAASVDPSATGTATASGAPDDAAAAGAGDAASSDAATAASSDAAGVASSAAATASASSATATDVAPADPSGSDMWVAQADGAGSAELTWQAVPGRWSLLVVGTTASGAAAPPTVEMAWPRTVTTPYLVPGCVAGALLVLLALGLLWRDVRRGHRAAEWTPVLTEPIPVVDGTGTQPVLTRRQIREMRALAEAGLAPVLPAAAGEPSAATAPMVADEPAGEPAAAASAAGRHDDAKRAERAAAPAGVHDEPAAAAAGVHDEARRAPRTGRAAARTGVHDEPVAAATGRHDEVRRASRTGRAAAGAEAHDEPAPTASDEPARKSAPVSSSPSAAAPPTPPGAAPTGVHDEPARAERVGGRRALHAGAAPAWVSSAAGAVGLGAGGDRGGDTHVRDVRDAAGELDAELPAPASGAHRPAWAPVRSTAASPSGTAGSGTGASGTSGSSPADVPSSDAPAWAGVPRVATPAHSAHSAHSAEPLAAPDRPTEHAPAHEPAWLQAVAASHAAADAAGPPDRAPAAATPIGATPTGATSDVAIPAAATPTWAPTGAGRAATHRGAHRPDATPSAPSSFPRWPTAQTDTGAPAAPDSDAAPGAEPGQPATAKNQSEPSRAAAWRRAWGLPPLETEETEGEER